LLAAINDPDLKNKTFADFQGVATGMGTVKDQTDEAAAEQERLADAAWTDWTRQNTVEEDTRNDIDWEDEQYDESVSEGRALDRENRATTTAAAKETNRRASADLTSRFGQEPKVQGWEPVNVQTFLDQNEDSFREGLETVQAGLANGDEWKDVYGDLLEYMDPAANPGDTIMLRILKSMY
jgi:hypothetical protein